MEASGPNAQQIAYWNEQAGPNWVGNQELLDAQIGTLGRLTIEQVQATRRRIFRSLMNSFLPI